MDDDDAGVSTHQVVLVEQDRDGGVDAELRECVGQQEGQHEHLTSGILEACDGVGRRDTQDHGNTGGDDRHDEGLCDRGDQTLLAEYVAPPFETPLLRKDGRSLILVCEGEHQHIDHRSVEEQDKRREQDKFKKLASAYRMVEAFWIEHFEH